jgi:opacity protein-like surface antigen
MFNKKWLVSLLGAAAITVSTGALAQATVPNFYIGAEVGQGDNSESDTGFKFLGGYQFHKNIAAELGYGMLIDKNSVEVTTIEAVAVGIFPLTPNFSILGKLGFANVDVETPVGSEDKTELTYGVGVQWDFTRNLGVRGTWQAYNADPDDVSYISVGVVWRF